MSTFSTANLNAGDSLVVYNPYDKQYALYSVLSMSDAQTANLASLKGKENVLTTLTERSAVNEAGEPVTVHVLHQTRKWAGSKMAYVPPVTEVQVVKHFAKDALDVDPHGYIEALQGARETLDDIKVPETLKSPTGAALEAIHAVQPGEVEGVVEQVQHLLEQRLVTSLAAYETASSIIEPLAAEEQERVDHFLGRVEASGYKPGKFVHLETEIPHAYHLSLHFNDILMVSTDDGWEYIQAKSGSKTHISVRNLDTSEPETLYVKAEHEEGYSGYGCDTSEERAQCTFEYHYRMGVYIVRADGSEDKVHEYTVIPCSDPALMVEHRGTTAWQYGNLFNLCNELDAIEAGVDYELFDILRLRAKAIDLVSENGNLYRFRVLKDYLKKVTHKPLDAHMGEVQRTVNGFAEMLKVIASANV